MPTFPLSHWTAGPFLVACALLTFAGAMKLVRPGSTRTAAHALGLPSSTIAVVVLGAVEVGCGATGAAFGGVAALGVAACYVLLTFAVVRLLRSAPSTPCGCLGSSTATVSRTHVVVNAVACASAILAAPHGAPLDDFGGGPTALLTLGVLLAVAVGLVELVMDALPELGRLARRSA